MPLPAVLAPLAPVIWGAFLTIIGSVVFRVLTAVGIGFATFHGVDRIQRNIKAEIMTAFSDLPPQVYQLAAYIGLGTCVNIVLSAIAIRVVIKTFGKAAGAITTMVFLGKSGENP